MVSPFSPDPLRLLKSALCNLLWPTGGGCLYGHGCTAEIRVANDEQLRALLDHFGQERLLELTVRIRTEVVGMSGYQWRSYIGYMKRLRDLMHQERQSPTAARAGRASGPTPEQSMGRQLSAQAEQSRTAAEAAAARFDALPDAEQVALMKEARRSNLALRNRAYDSPILRAAAIALMPAAGEDRGHRGKNGDTIPSSPTSRNGDGVPVFPDGMVSPFSPTSPASGAHHA